MRFLYFAYFLLKSDYKIYLSGIRCKSNEYNAIILILDSLFCSIKYGTSLDDYFSFRFYDKNNEAKSNFATTAFMYEFHKKLNNKQYIAKIDNKIQFNIHYYEYANKAIILKLYNKAWPELLTKQLLSYDQREFVLKDPNGTTGKDLLFFTFIPETKKIKYNGNTYNLSSFIKKYVSDESIYIEPLLSQHKVLSELNPGSLNTIRVISVLNHQGYTDIVSAVLRIGINDKTDNFSQGNLAAAVDIKSGVVISPGIKRNAACSPIFYNHPITGYLIKGLQLPDWKLVTELISKASKRVPEVRTVGWDVALTSDGPVLIEGNPKWNKGAPQIPMDIGIKPLLLKYI